MGKGPKAEPGHIATSSGGIETSFKVGHNLDEMVQLFGPDVVYEKAKTGMHTQLHTHLEATVKRCANGKGGTNKANVEKDMVNFRPTVGRQKVDPLVKAMDGLTKEEQRAKIAAFTQMLDASDN